MKKIDKEFNPKTDKTHLVCYRKNSMWDKLLGVRNETKTIIKTDSSTIVFTNVFDTSSVNKSK
jgi:hypothetical protein